MRADRLVRALLVLQARGRVTAGQLATELEVSVATARRDLEALAVAGVPVYSRPGRGGGWSLVGGARTDLSGLTSVEARALFVRLGPARVRDPRLDLVSRKLLRALPRTLRAEAWAAGEGVVVDAAWWGAQATAGSRPWESLWDAVVRRRWVWLEYVDRVGRRTTRRAAPAGLVEKGGVWYLLADTSRGRRTFRVERIVSVLVTEETVERAEEFSLTREWAEVVEEVEGLRSATRVLVCVPERLLVAFTQQFGRQCEVAGQAEDGRFRVWVAAPDEVMVARQLAGWGALVEVVGAPGVRAALARIGAELVASAG